MGKKKTAKKPRASGPKSSKRRIKKPPVLFEQTQAVVRYLDETLDGTFLTYWTSESGSICGNDVQAMHEILRMVQQRFAAWKRAMAEAEPRGPFRDY